MDKGYRQLTLKERKEIEDGLNRGDSFRAIARLIGRSPSTVSREVRENRHVRAFRPRRGACRDRVLPPMHFPPIDVFNLNTLTWATSVHSMWSKCPHGMSCNVEDVSGE